MGESRVTKEHLKQQTIFVGTPMYGGMCSGLYSRSVSDLSAICTRMGINLQLYYLFNESLITRARNYICDEFMRSNATHLMFIDADIGFNAHDILGLLSLTLEKPDEYHLIGGPYPKKCISWEKIVQAVNKGMADPPKGKPQDLEKYVGDYVFNPKQGNGTIMIREPAEVLEIGTGFMMIPRATMVKFNEVFYEKYKYRPDHVRTEAFDGSRYITQFFQAEIDPKSERYLSEDYWFTQKCHEIGMRTWLCPWMQLQHMGTMIFGGSLADLASIGAAATADSGLLKQKRKVFKK